MFQLFFLIFNNALKNSEKNSAMVSIIWWTHSVNFRKFSAFLCFTRQVSTLKESIDLLKSLVKHSNFSCTRYSRIVLRTAPTAHELRPFNPSTSQFNASQATSRSSYHAIYQPVTTHRADYAATTQLCGRRFAIANICGIISCGQPGIVGVTARCLIDRWNFYIKLSKRTGLSCSEAGDDSIKYW